MELNLVGPSYADTVFPLSRQDTINWIPEPVEAEGRTKFILRTPAGLKALVSGITLGDTVTRGLWVMADTLYAVIGVGLYQISSTGVGVSLGYVSGSGFVSMADNGYQLVIVNGPQGYVYNKNTGVFSQITDTDFVGAYTVAFLDQYFIFDGMGGQFYLSSLGDGTQYDALDFATAEYSPDNTVAVVVDHQELLVFGKKTIEPWFDSGNPDFPLNRSQGTVIEQGTGSRRTICKVDNTVYFLGDNGIVYQLQGHTPNRISSYAIEQEIQRYKDRLDQFIAWSYVDKGHWFYVLQCPMDGKTFVYDASLGALDVGYRWHRRQSYGLTRWRAQFVAQAYGKTIVGDYNTGDLWEFDETALTEGDDPLVSDRYTQYLHGDQEPIFNHSLEILFDTGHGLADGSEAFCEVRWSDDGGRNWSNFKQRSLGAVGQYGKRVKIHGLGMFRSRIFHIRVSDPVKRDLLTGYIRPTQGVTA